MCLVYIRCIFTWFYKNDNHILLIEGVFVSKWVSFSEIAVGKNNLKFNSNLD